jgi:hypothetical protein
MASGRSNTGGFTHESTQSQSVEWYTPPSVFDRLGVTFDLDPCSPGKNVVPWIPAKCHLTRKDDGLSRPWKGRVWLNPPYGRHIGTWLKRLSQHGDGIALVFARTDTKWFHRHAMRASAICFLEGRLKFIRSDGREAGPPGCGSLLLAFGDECAEILRRSRLGLCITPPKRSK